jgi:heme-degrading monooxygenase HmoA
MIERHWKGIARLDQAEKYVEHLMTDTFPKLHSIKGFIRASILRRQVGDGMEFLIVTVWNSMSAIREFAGEQAEKAVVPEAVQRMMTAFDAVVSQYEVVI